MGYDVIIAGLGAMGSAAAYHLASRGLKVLGLDRFGPLHQLGSSHGKTRIIREAYFEDPVYVPLVQRAYQLWSDLEQKTGSKLFTQTGAVLMGPPGGEVIAGGRLSADTHGLAYRMLSLQDLAELYPMFRPSEEMVGLWEPRAGALYPEKCIEAHLNQAKASGAAFHFEEPVLDWTVKSGVVTVNTALGHYEADHLILSTGAWMNQLLGNLQLPLTVERQVVLWFEPRASAAEFDPSRCPIFFFEYGRDRHFYGFPDLGDGVKVALHHQGEITTADGVYRQPRPEEIQTVESLIQRYLPGAAGPLIDSTICLYTNTPDFHFLIDRHPGYEQVQIISACSGHGFKFCGAIGEIIANRIAGPPSVFDITRFSVSRLY